MVDPQGHWRDCGGRCRHRAVWRRTGACAVGRMPAWGRVRPGSEVPSGMRLLEVDPRGVKAQCRGIPPRAAAIAAATLTALRELLDAPRSASRAEVAAWLT